MLRAEASVQPLSCVVLGRDTVQSVTTVLQTEDVLCFGCCSDKQQLSSESLWWILRCLWQWLMSVIPALLKAEKEDQEFKVIPGYNMLYMTPCLRKQHHHHHHHRCQHHHQEQKNSSSSSSSSKNKPTYQVQTLSKDHEDSSMVQNAPALWDWPSCGTYVSEGFASGLVSITH